MPQIAQPSASISFNLLSSYFSESTFIEISEKVPLLIDFWIEQLPRTKTSTIRINFLHINKVKSFKFNKLKRLQLMQHNVCMNELF